MRFSPEGGRYIAKPTVLVAKPHHAIGSTGTVLLIMFVLLPPVEKSSPCREHDLSIKSISISFLLQTEKRESSMILVLKYLAGGILVELFVPGCPREPLFSEQSELSISKD